jgi:hypothetical protein
VVVHPPFATVAGVRLMQPARHQKLSGAGKPPIFPPFAYLVLALHATASEVRLLGTIAPRIRRSMALALSPSIARKV